MSDEPVLVNQDGAVVTLIRNRRRMPVATRNVDLKSRINIPDAPPFGMLERSAEKMLHLDLAAVAGILVAAAVESSVPGFIGIGITIFLGCLYVLALVPFVRGSKVPPNAETVLAAVDDWLREWVLDPPDRVILSLAHTRTEETAAGEGEQAEPEVIKRGKGEEA